MDSAGGTGGRGGGGWRYRSCRTLKCWKQGQLTLVVAVVAGDNNPAPTGTMVAGAGGSGIVIIRYKFQ